MQAMILSLKPYILDRTPASQVRYRGEFLSSDNQVVYTELLNQFEIFSQ